MLDIHLLGEFRLLYGEAPVNGVNTPRLQSLLAYLLMHRDGAATIEIADIVRTGSGWMALARE